MAEINLQRLSRRLLSACNRVTSETKSRAFLITGGVMIQRLENAPEIMMQAAIRRAFSQATFAALPFPSSSDDTWLYPDNQQSERPFASPTRTDFGPLAGGRKLGSEERMTGSFGGLFHTRGLM
jgi:hypothetical protein